MTTQNEAPVWPLPLGHYFGPAAMEGHVVACHSGRNDWLEKTKLELWQRHFKEVWDRAFEITGQFDGPTQDAVERVQKAAGREPTGRLDALTWDAVWTTPPDKSSVKTRPGPSTRSAFAKPLAKGK